MARANKQASQGAVIRRAVVLVGMLATCVLVQSNRAQTVPSRPVLTEPYIMRDDFQGDSLGQWASYPPAQDIGYEPSISPTSQFNAPGGRSLMRVVKPNVPGTLRFGFIKKVRIVVSDDAMLGFTYRVNTPATAEVEMALAGANGILYTKKVPAQTNRWTVGGAKLSDFRDARGLAPLPGVRIEAIYVVANLADGDPDTTYRFMIDDLSLRALHDADFNVTTPATEAIEPWPELLSERPYLVGDTVRVEAAAPAKLFSVSCLLNSPSKRVTVNQKLYDDGTHGDRRSGDGIWSNNQLYAFSSADQAGLWQLQLEGVTANSEIVKTVVRLLLHPQASKSASAHPNLFFAAADRQTLIRRSQDPKLAGLWTNLLTTAKNTRATGMLAHGGDVFELLDSEYLLPSLLAYFDVLNRARSRIAHNAFEAYLTESAEARSAAKTAMLDVAKWKRWQPPWFNSHGQHTYYPAGLLAADVALGYDLLYHDLTETERAEIRRALIEKSIIPTYKEYVVDNRLMTNTSNWISHTVGGALIAAASIAHDERTSDGASSSEEQFEIYVHGLLLKFEDHMRASYLADGSYGEGISYHEFDSETLGPALNALRRAFGIDYWKQTHVLDSLTYPLYTLTQPTSNSLDMGDTHAPGGHGIAPIIFESKDPVLRWYYDLFDRPSLSRFIFYNNSVAPQMPTAPELPTSRIFHDKGNAVFRSGWDKDAIVFLYRAGPNFNHHHADQGSFLLNAFGENLITEAGWSDYYKDPYYATFFTQAIGHSTVLVDGNPESQNVADTPQFAALNKYPRITHSITSEFHDSIRSELSSVYQNRLNGYVRSVVFVKPHYFVVYDDLSVNGKPAQFDFLLHLPDRNRITINNSGSVYKGYKAWLGVRSFEPKNSKLSVENGRIPYHILAARTPAETPAQPAYLDWKTTQPSQETQFLTAIVPAKSEDSVHTLIDQMTGIAGTTSKGIRVNRGKETDSVLFRVGNTQTIRDGEWSTDAATLVTTLGGNDLRMFAVLDARTLNRANQILFASKTPINAAANYASDGIDVACNSDAGSAIRLFVGKIPARVLLDGEELNPNAFSFNRADRTISLTVPGGQRRLKVIFR